MLIASLRIGRAGRTRMTTTTCFLPVCAGLELRLCFLSPPGCCDGWAGECRVGPLAAQGTLPRAAPRPPLFPARSGYCWPGDARGDCVSRRLAEVAFLFAPGRQVFSEEGRYLCDDVCDSLGTLGASAHLGVPFVDTNNMFLRRRAAGAHHCKRPQADDCPAPPPRHSVMRAAHRVSSPPAGLRSPHHASSAVRSPQGRRAPSRRPLVQSAEGRRHCGEPGALQRVPRGVHAAVHGAPCVPVGGTAHRDQPTRATRVAIIISIPCRQFCCCR